MRGAFSRPQRLSAQQVYWYHLFVFYSGINSTPVFPTSTRCAARFSQNKTPFGQNVAPTLDDKTVRFK